MVGVTVTEDVGVTGITELEGVGVGVMSGKIKSKPTGLPPASYSPLINSSAFNILAFLINSLPT